MKPHVWLVLVSLILPALAAGQMTPLGGELTVAQAPGVLHRSPAVSAGEFGNFVVVWQRHAGGPEGWDVLARRYDRSGAPLGLEILVNTTTAGCQQAPAVASDSAGNFVVVWQSDGQDGSGWGVFGRGFDAAGNAVSPEYLVSPAAASTRRARRSAGRSPSAPSPEWRGDPRCGCEDGDDDDDDRGPCEIQRDRCLESPWQPPWNRRLFGPRKNCRDCYRECLEHGGLWPVYKCPF